MYSKLLLLTVFFIFIEISFSHNHGHEDGHSHEEPASFKYSRQANEDYLNKKHHHEDHHHQHKSSKKQVPLNTQDLWLHAMGSTLLISAAPFFILFFVPLDNTDKQQPLLKVLLAFASGGLLGDAFLHLIPHATMGSEDSHSHSHSHSHEHGHDMSVGLWVLSGIVTFLIIEKGMRIFKSGHGHSHSVKPVASKSSKNSKKNEDTKGKKDQEIKIAGYLNLAADFSHNFTDGLAIGSSYLAGNAIGIVTTITILLHEIPHEIGDFAILIQSGVSRRNAMLLQLGTATAALLGTTISIMAQNIEGATGASCILPFTAGGFIYIALVSVIPELLEEDKPTIKQTFLQVFAMLCGVGLMVLISIFE